MLATAELHAIQLKATLRKCPPAIQEKLGFLGGHGWASGRGYQATFFLDLGPLDDER